MLFCCLGRFLVYMMVDIFGCGDWFFLCGCRGGKMYVVLRSILYER